MRGRSDTIVAVSSPPGRGALGIVRLSGPEAAAVACRLLEERSARAAAEAAGFTALPVRLRRPPVEARLYVFRAPASYTREEVVEFHLPAAFPLTSMVAEEAERAGARPALPGEFTRRAFLNGRIGLEGVEAVLAAVSATSRQELRRAQAMRSGRGSRALGAVAEELRLVAGDLLACLDFPEEDVEFVAPGEAARRLRRLARELGRSCGEGPVRAGMPRAVLLGRVNTGKTTLLNALSGAGRIVSPLPGTTRDVLEEVVRTGEGEVLLLDTPGIGETGPLAELTAEASLAAARAAEMVLLCLRCDDPRPPRELREVLEEGRSEGAAVVATFADLAGAQAAFAAGGRWLEEAGVRVFFRVATGMRGGRLEGVEALRAGLEDVLARGLLRPAPEAPFSLAVLAGRAAALLEEAAGEAQEGAFEVAYHLVEEALMLMEGGLGGAPLAVDEAVLEGVFRRFCVGK